MSNSTDQNNPLRGVSTYALVKELRRRTKNTTAITCVKKENIYVITVDEREVEI